MKTSGIDVMESSGKWSPLEVHLFGENWQTEVEPWFDRFESIKGDSAVSRITALNMLKDEGCSQDILDYLDETLGLTERWWDFMLGTGEPVLVFSTEQGFCKATNTKEFLKIQKNGKIAIEMRDGDAVVDVVEGHRFKIDDYEVAERLSEAKHIDAEFNLGIEERIKDMVDEFADFCFLGTADGIASKFPLHELKARGRASKGLSGIKLKGDDKVVGFDIVTNDDEIVLVTEKGIGKRVKVSDFRNMKRGAVGVKCLNVSEKTGRVVAALALKSTRDELMFLTASGQMIRIQSMQVPRYKRQAKGVSIMRLKEGDKLITGSVIRDDLQESN